MLLLLLLSVFCVAITEPLSVSGGGGSRRRRSPWALNDQQRVYHGTGSSNTGPDEVIHTGSAAVMFGDGHVITFDGRYYNHALSSAGMACPHVLARDYRSYSFIILQTRQSITVYTGRTVVTVHHNNKVEVNNTGDFRDQPVLTWDGSLSVTNDNRDVLIQTTVGVRIECHVAYRQCVFEMDGTVSNSSNGLLGTNDNNPVNDFTLRSGEEAGSLNEFINHYELTGTSACRPDINVSGQSCASHSTHHCRQLFQAPASPLATCFGTVSAVPYMKACQKDTTSCHHGNDGDAECSSIRAYVKMCSIRGVNMQIPNNCVSCAMHSFGSIWNEHSHTKLDIVIATSRSTATIPSNCHLGDRLHSLADSVLGHLRVHGRIQNVRLGLLAYGATGLLQNPHAYTFRGEAFTRHHGGGVWRDHLQALVADGPGGNTDSALQTVLNYPFRSDAVKVVILVVDSTENLSPSQLVELQTQFQTRDIFLNLLTRTTELSPSHILGIRENSQLLTMSTQPGQQQGLSISQLPNDPLSRLTVSTGGVLFDVDALCVPGSHLSGHLAAELLRQVRGNMRRCRTCQCGPRLGADGHVSCTSQICS